MGLDMYAESGKVGSKETKKFHYWRKHRDLDDWMSRLYTSKTGVRIRDIKDACIYEVELDATDLNNLERDIQAGKLKPQRGEDPADDLNFIAKARRYLTEGRRVIYWANW